MVDGESLAGLIQRRAARRVDPALTAPFSVSAALTPVVDTTPAAAASEAGPAADWTSLSSVSVARPTTAPAATAGTSGEIERAVELAVARQLDARGARSRADQATNGPMSPPMIGASGATTIPSGKTTITRISAPVSTSVQRIAGDLPDLPGVSEMDRIVDAVEERVLRELERRGGRFTGAF
ncbi:MAG: hypothetical protein AAF567_03680 [Actinomycetota bacterium]